MKKAILLILMAGLLLGLSGFSYHPYNNKDEDSGFSLSDLKDYQKKYETEEIGVCAFSSAKTYMDYRATTVVSSRQYQFMRKYMQVDKNTGFLLDEDNFIGVALGSYYGEIGDRYYFTLESGIVLPLVKVEEKADEDTDYYGCYQVYDKSIMEFVIDEDYAAGCFGWGGNGLVLNGNYNNYSLFEGSIIKVEKVLDELNPHYVTYSSKTVLPGDEDIFNYASGY